MARTTTMERALLVSVVVMLVIIQAAQVRTMHSDLPGRVCAGDRDIRNSPKRLMELKGCRVIEGYLQIVLMENSPAEEFEGMSFPELREVSSYLLVWKVFGLRSLGQLFPNLTIIRGNEVMMDHFSFVVHETPNLRQLGLSSLQFIYNGAVRVTENMELCFAESIDWYMIAPSDKNNVSGNMDPKQCERCMCEGNKGCWARRLCQEKPQPLLARGSDTIRCHERCALGCWGSRSQDCFACRQLELNGDCVERCPNGWVSLTGRRCIRIEECENMRSRGEHGGVVFKGACIQMCPPGYRQIRKQRRSTDKIKKYTCQACLGPCGPCPGAMIRSLADARHFRGCTVVTGTLEIMIPRGHDIETELEQNLGTIQEIHGSLVVSRSRPLSSLHFLRSLRLIKGEWSDRKLSLFVNENDNLQYLFDWGEGDKGKSPLVVTSYNNKTNVTFYYNPRLCPQEIKKFIEITKVEDTVSQFNGFINPCGATDGTSRVTLRGSSFVKLAWDAHKSDRLIGYALYIIKALKENVIEYGETNLCDMNSEHWMVHDVQFDKSASEVNAFVPHLEAATLYAYYIKTYTEVDNVFSAIKYFRTTSTRPTMPTNVLATPVEGGDLLVSWGPPYRPNGVISHYIVIGELREEDEEQLARRDYCVHPVPSIKARPVASSKPHDTCCCDGCCDVELDEDQCERLIREGPHSPTASTPAVVDACGKPVYSMDRCKHLLYTIVNEKLLTASSRFPTDEPEYYLPEINLAEEWVAEKNGSDWVRRFVRTLDADARTTRVSRLRPFGMYFLEVHVCGLKDEEQNPSPLDALCSAAAIVTVRAAPVVIADSLEYVEVKATSSSDALHIIHVNWTEPERPNGMVVSYQIRCVHKTDASKSRELCVSRQSHRKDGGGLRIAVEPGMYAVHLRATSLAGPGPWLAAGTVQVGGLHPALPIVVVVVLFVVLSLVCAGLLLRWYRRRRQAQTSDTRHLVASDSDPTDWWDLPSEDQPAHQVAAFRRVGQGESGVVSKRTTRGSTRQQNIVIRGDPSSASASLLESEGSSARQSVSQRETDSGSACFIELQTMGQPSVDTNPFRSKVDVTEQEAGKLSSDESYPSSSSPRKSPLKAKKFSSNLPMSLDDESTSGGSQVNPSVSEAQGSSANEGEKHSDTDTRGRRRRHRSGQGSFSN